jgi:hypothetical protein
MRYKVVVWQGESGTVFCVVDSWAAHIVPTRRGMW